MALAMSMRIQPNKDSGSPYSETLLDALPGIAFARSLALKWPFTYLSAGCKPLTGYTPADLLADSAAPFRLLVAGEDLSRASEMIRRAAESKEGYSIQYRLQTKGGVEKLLSEKGSPAFDDTGKLTGYNGFISDITEFRQREKKNGRIDSDALQAERDMLRTIVDALPDFIFVKDSRGHYVLSNAAHTRSLGVNSSEDVDNRTSFDFFDRERAEKFTADDHHVISTGEAIINREEAREGRESGRGWARTTKIPLRNPQGEITGVVCISRDISERKHLEEELRQAQKMEAIGRLAGGVAHDFNNILTSITGFSEILLGNPILDEAAHKDVEEIYSAAIRAAALTQQLLTFSRKQIVQPSLVNLNEVVGGLDRMLQRIIGANVTFSQRLEAASPGVEIDPSQMEQVITNIVVNAIDAMPAGGKLTIATSNATLDQLQVQGHAAIVPGAYVRLTITDTGEGIAPEVKDRIFEPFFTTKPVGRGTGLGLSTSYGIVRQNGGHINVESELGSGTTVNIYLPAKAAPQPGRTQISPAPSADVRLPGGTETVLLVEDDSSVRKLTASMLSKLGYSILEASDGACAMDVIRECDTRKIDLLLTDIVMPQIGGKRLADSLGLLSPGTKVLFTSGHNEEEMLLQGIAAREISFLPKPYSPATLATKVREVLDHR